MMYQLKREERLRCLFLWSKLSDDNYVFLFSHRYLRICFVHKLLAEPSKGLCSAEREFLV